MCARIDGMVAANARLVEWGLWKLSWYCRELGMSKDELRQEARLVLWRVCLAHDQSRGAPLACYFLRSLRYHLIQLWKRQGRTPATHCFSQLCPDEMERARPFSPENPRWEDPWEKLERDERKRAIRAAIKRSAGWMPPGHLAVLDAWLDGETLMETAKRLRVSTARIRNLRLKIRSDLREGMLLRGVTGPWCF